MGILFSKFTKTVIIIDLFSFSLLLLLCVFDIDKFKDLVFSISFVVFVLFWFILNMAYIKHRSFFESLIGKYCGPQAITALKEDCEVSKSIEKLQDKIVIPQEKSPEVVQEIKDNALKEQNKELNELFGYIEQGKCELAISKAQDKLKTAKTEKSEFICRFILYLAYMASENDQYLTDIIDNIQKLILLIKKHPKDIRLSIDVRYNLMVAYARQGEFEKVKKENHALLKEIKENSKFPVEMKYRCYNMQAAVYLRENNIPYAMGYFDKALKYSEDNFDILFNMALTYYYTGRDVNKCLEYIDRIDPTQISENDERYHLFVVIQCYCLALKKDYLKAYEIIDNYLNFNHDTSYELKGDKAYIAYKLNKFDEAQKLSDEVLSLVSEATSTNVRGMLQLNKGKYEEAYNNFQSIITKFMDGDKYFLGEIYYHCSYACLKLNKIDEAIDYFNKVKETNYNDFDCDYIVDLDMAQQERVISKEKKDCSND